MSKLFRVYLFVWVYIFLGVVLVCFNLVSINVVLGTIKLVLLYAIYVLYKTIKIILKKGDVLCEN